MPDKPSSPEPHRTRRPRRFVVRDADDHRVNEKIEAFLAGPRDARRRRPRSIEPIKPTEGALDTRADFVTALRRETARAERYGRPVSVVAVAFDLAGPEPGFHGRRSSATDQIDRLAGPIGFTLRREARDTDRIARVAPNRFHVLLPETSEADATRFIERARQACEVWFAGASLPVRLRMESAAATDDRSLTEALEALEEELTA